MTITSDNRPDIEPDPDPELSEIIEKRDNIEEVDITTTLTSPETSTRKKGLLPPCCRRISVASARIPTTRSYSTSTLNPEQCRTLPHAVMPARYVETKGLSQRRERGRPVHLLFQLRAQGLVLQLGINMLRGSHRRQ